MPLGRSLLISALLHSMLLWGVFATYLPLKERIFLVEIAEAPSAHDAAGRAEQGVRHPRPLTADGPGLSAPTPPQERPRAGEPAAAVPETAVRQPLSKDTAASGPAAEADARPMTIVPAGAPAGASPRPGGAPQAAGQGRPLVSLADGGGGGNESLLGQLRARIQRSLVYPHLARKRKMEGTTTVSFAVSEGGVPVDLRLVQSSGYSLLDDEALNTLRRAAPLPVLRGTVEIPIRFRLSDGE